MIKRLMKYNKGFNTIIVIYLILQMVFSAVSMLSAEVLRMAVNAIEYLDAGILYQTIVLGIITTIVYVIVDYATRITEQKAFNAGQKNFQLQVIDKLIRLKKQESNQFSSGDILTRLTQNTPRAVIDGIGSLGMIIQGFVLVAISMVYMGVLSFPLAVAMGLYNILVRVFTPIFNKKIKQVNSQLVKQNLSSNSFFVQLLNNAIVLRVFDRIQYFTNLFKGKETRICRNNLKSFALSNGASEVIWASQRIAEIALLYGLGGILIYQGRMDFGVIAAFTIASDLLGKGLILLVDGYAERNAVAPHIDTLCSFLDNPNIEEGKRLPSLGSTVGQGKIAFEHVCFAYGDKLILSDVSFQIPAGSRVLIKGENGAGKSTLIKLLCGLYRPQSGKILLDGLNIIDLHIDSIGEQCTYIPQIPLILPGDADENISFPDKPDSSRCKSLMEEFRIRDVDKTIPESFSQGEKQRLCIARSVYGIDKKCVVLGDEIFANVDPDNKDQIASIINRNAQGKSVLMICHEQVPFPFDYELLVEQGKAVLRPLASSIKSE